MNVLDKAEYQDLLDQIQNCVNKKDYQKAYTLAKKIDWKRVKSFRTLNMIADIYEINKDYADCKNVLLIARSRASVGKGILYRLVEVCLKLGDIDEAEGYYSEYVSIAANDTTSTGTFPVVYAATNTSTTTQKDDTLKKSTGKLWNYI